MYQTPMLHIIEVESIRYELHHNPYADKSRNKST